MSRPPALLFPLLPWAALGMLAAAFNALLRVAIAPLFIQPMFDSVFEQNNLAALPRVLAAGVVIVALGSAMLWAQDAWLGRSAALVAARWREAVYLRLLGRPPGHLGGSSGGLASRVLTDLRDVENYLQFGLGTLVAESLTLIGILVVLLYSNATATLYLIVMVVPLGVSLWLAGKRVERSAREAQESTEEVGAHLQEGLKHHEVVKAFGLNGFLLARLARANQATASAQTRRALWAGLQTPLAQVLGFLAIAALLVVLARSMAAGEMSLGAVTAYITLLALIATPAQLLPKGYALLQGARAAKTRLQALYGDVYRDVGEASETPPPPHQAAAPLRDAFEGGTSVRLSGLSFGYPDGPPLFHGLEVLWQGPKLVVLTGPSGSGKSTLLRVMLRFLKPTSGEILLGGRDLQTIDEAGLREAVAYVPQDSSLFRASLRDNLLLGRRYRESELWRALEAVRLDGVVRGLVAGLAHNLSEDGAGFSGGQKQRLAVARALLCEPAILLLDEPSANLDEKSERVIIDTLREQARSRLVVVVAHRPAVVRAADEVFELTAFGTLEPVTDVGLSSQP